MRLDGKVALITGAATGVEGQLMGFGGASARLFSREGAKVVLGDVNEAGGEKTAAQIREGGGEALFLRLDVTSEEDWSNAVGTVLETYGRLDVLVNNAGTAEANRIEDVEEEVWDAQMAVHAKGAFLGMKHAIPAMRQVGGGSIINISSIAGIIGGPTSAYAAAKGAVRILTKSAAVQYAGDKIRVNSVHPGYHMTPLTQVNFSKPEERKQRIANVPLGRYGDADDIANGILYLASDESSYVTGAELVIDGGVTAH